MKSIKQVSLITMCLITSILTTGQNYYDDFQQSEKLIVFFDDYNNNVNDWLIGKKGANESSIHDGFLNLKRNSMHGSKPELVNISVDMNRNFEIETSIKVISNDNNSSYLTFGYDQEGQVGCRLGFDQYCIVIKNETLSEDQIVCPTKISNDLFKNNTFFNKFTIRKFDLVFYFFINNKLFFASDKPILSGTYFGFEPGSNSEILIDNLSIYYLKDNINLSFRQAKAQNTVSAYENFIKNFPLDSLTREAQIFLGEAQKKLEYEALNSQISDVRTLTDLRDGEVYNTVKIGNKIWMAENLNYATPFGSCCYDNNLKYCDRYGRLYDYKTANKVCPSGWHLPSEQEFDNLMIYANSSKAYKTLVGSGENSIGFNSLFGGYYCDQLDIFDGRGYYVAYKSSTQGVYLYIHWPESWEYARVARVSRGGYPGLIDSKCYVRCVKD